MLAFLKSLDKTRSPERSDCATTVLTNSLRLVYAGDCSWYQKCQQTLQTTNKTGYRMKQNAMN